jgi:hypothetical protein
MSILLAIACFCAAIGLGSIAFKRADDAFRIDRRLNLPARGNARVNWRRA